MITTTIATQNEVKKVAFVKVLLENEAGKIQDLYGKNCRY
jgi:hypothetical protein